MASHDSLAPDDAIPVVDTMARAREARRLHHRQIIRRGMIAGLIVAIVGLLSLVAVPVFRQLRESWLLEAAGFKVDWQIGGDNWMTGGATHVSFKQLRSSAPSPYDLDLKILPRLLNVTSVNLPECTVTEQGLNPLRGLDHLTSLNLARLDHFRYGSSATALSDACLVPIQGLSQLENLSLAGNRITDDGLALIAGLHELGSLDLTATDVTDAGLVHLQPLKKLKNLSLGGTLVTPQGVRALQSALPGLEIDLDISPEVERAVKQLRGLH